METSIPSKAEIALLPVFTGLHLAQIVIPSTDAEFAEASAAILAAQIVGFDTESKPTFKVGELSDGPHVVQFALSNQAYLFQLNKTVCWRYLRELLQAEELQKVGFDLQSDRRHILAKLGVTMAGVIDLNQCFSQIGYPKHLGVRTAVALVFQQRFVKSKKVTTSNWSLSELTPQQRCYAANDAYAALRVWQQQFAHNGISDGLCMENR